MIELARFTAGQAAQKSENMRNRQTMWFTAGQAAQKLPESSNASIKMFTAGQAAQKSNYLYNEQE